uniref:(California timema) hypothetical protein n=1 Tax=Timema californicum TaxID=61474 RepID=A0A7R9IY69_TIMCA|nr:unnamed protein product [Timema californicum]
MPTKKTLTLDDINSILNDDENIIEAKVFTSPPEQHSLSDEDSEYEYFINPEINHFSGNQLRATAESPTQPLGETGIVSTIMGEEDTPEECLEYNNTSENENKTKRMKIATPSRKWQSLDLPFAPELNWEQSEWVPNRCPTATPLGLPEVAQSGPRGGDLTSYPHYTGTHYQPLSACRGASLLTHRWPYRGLSYAGLQRPSHCPGATLWRRPNKILRDLSVPEGGLDESAAALLSFRNGTHGYNEVKQELDKNSHFMDREHIEEPILGPAALGLQRVGEEKPPRPLPTQPGLILNRRGMPARIRKRNRLFFDDDVVSTLLPRSSPKRPKNSTIKKAVATSHKNLVSHAKKHQTTQHHITYRESHAYENSHDQPDGSLLTSDKKVSQRLGMRLRNLLKLPKAHKWVCYEWFYSNIDK